MDGLLYTDSCCYIGTEAEWLKERYTGQKNFLEYFSISVFRIMSDI